MTNFEISQMAFIGVWFWACHLFNPTFGSFVMALSLLQRLVTFRRGPNNRVEVGYVLMQTMVCLELFDSNYLCH